MDKTQLSEWTPEYVESMVLDEGGHLNGKPLAVAHNAALAAEENKRADWNIVIEDLEAALKSKEDELQAFLTDADSARDSWIKANEELKQQLAAEREQWQLTVEECHRIISRKNEELAAERKNKDGYSSGYETARAEYAAQLAVEREKVRLLTESAANRKARISK